MKKLTVNRLALGNLKHRRKQYTIMIIGIILAMVFSSSVVFFAFSLKASMVEKAQSYAGKQSGMISLRADDTDTIEQMQKNGSIANYGTAHIIGFGYTDEEKYGVAVGWLDDKGDEISYRQLQEGKLPVGENEIAIEQNALVKLGYENAKVGDIIKLHFKIQSDFDFLDKETEKVYKLTGILKDKRKNLIGASGDSDRQTWRYYIPAGFVAANTSVDIGGHERVTYYYVTPNVNNIFGGYDEEKSALQEELFWEPLNKLGDSTEGRYEVNNSGAIYYFGDDARNISSALNYSIFIGVNLLLASCIAIVNAFNSNLKDRKKQIGMLRAVGATKRQIINTFGREALIISLICTPFSVLVSYGIVKFASQFFGEYFVMNSSLWVLFVSASVNLAVVLISAFIPLISASKITPMQAIRTVDYSKKMNKKRIKSQKQFNTAKLLSKRYGVFSKGSSIAISIILTATIFVSCAGFSLAVSTANNLRTIRSDYSFEGLNGDTYQTYYSTSQNGLTNSERNQIAALPYINSTEGYKNIRLNALIDSYDNNYYKILNYDAFPIWDINDEYGLKDLEVYQDAYKTHNKTYTNTKNSLGYSSDILPTNLLGADKNIVEDIVKKCKIEGDINYSALSQGKEIILFAPKRIADIRSYKKGKHYGSYMSNPTSDKEIQKALNDKNYDETLLILEGECPYKVGDEITLSWVKINESMAGDIEEEFVPNLDYKKEEHKVKIAAIVDTSPSEILNEFSDTLYTFDNFMAMTTVEGVDKMFSGAAYTNLDINLSVPVTEEIDKEVTEELSVFSEKHDASVRSTYQIIQRDKRDTLNTIMIIIALSIIAFAICGTIVNNSLAAKIRESKREIGTLRAVGASEKELVSSYVRRLLSTFAWGSGIGFAAYTVFHIVEMIVIKGNNDFKIYFPWFALGALAILFAICSISLWTKIRKEMKNSIVDNIREL